MYNVINDRNFYFEECLSALPGPHLAVVFIKEVLIRGCLGNVTKACSWFLVFIQVLKEFYGGAFLMRLWFVAVTLFAAS